MIYNISEVERDGMSLADPKINWGKGSEKKNLRRNNSYFKFVNL